MLAYNTVLVITGTTLFGLAAGLVGVFLLLRKRSLVSDAVAHATLPGVALGFLVALALGLNEGRHLPTLLAGAAFTGILGAIGMQWIKDHTRLTEDTATGIILSVFFGLGIVMLSYIQTLSTGSRAGLDSFLLGQTAALNLHETQIMGIMAAVTILTTLAFRKEMTLLCFDQIFADSCGFTVRRLDLVLMCLMLAVVCTGLKTVGLILVIALLIIPPCTARLWANNLSRILLISALTGGVSAGAGSLISAYLPDAPTGAIIVLVAAFLFLVSLLVNYGRSVVARAGRTA